MSLVFPSALESIALHYASPAIVGGLALIGIGAVATRMLRRKLPGARIAQEGIESASFRKGLERSSFGVRLAALFGAGSQTADEKRKKLEELLLTSDVGVKTTRKILDRISAVEGALEDEPSLRAALRTELIKLLERSPGKELLGTKVADRPRVFVMVGVNGVGKTTTVAKIARRIQKNGARVILGACDTFRAGAVEQLGIWAERLGLELMRAESGEKPTTVAFRTIAEGKRIGADVIIIDTAGRLHNRTNLMNELGAVIGIIARELPGAPDEVLLVVDGTTGQNALAQAREFLDKAALTGVIVTKLDGTAKGGMVVAIEEELGLPVRYIGVGEGVEDLIVFSAPDFVDALLSGKATTMERSPKARRRREALQ